MGWLRDGTPVVEAMGIALKAREGDEVCVGGLEMSEVREQGCGIRALKRLF